MTEDDPATAGNANALTTLTPVGRRGFFLPWLLHLVQRTGITLPPLQQLSFINFAHWSIVRRFPNDGPPQGPDPKRSRQMLFESNFNGTWDQYFDAFAQVMTFNFKLFWGSSPKFPGPMPTGPFRDWIRAHNTDANHYYCAYPDGTATTIRSSLALQRELALFAQTTSHMDPAQFQRAFETFVTQVQRDL